MSAERITLYVNEMQVGDESQIEKQWQAACAEDINGCGNGSGKQEANPIPAMPRPKINQDADPLEHDSGARNLLARCHEVAARVNGFLDEDLGHDEVLRAVQRQTRIALCVIADCLRRYNLEEISLSYNGGKDCLVLLILLLTALSNHQSSLGPPTSAPTDMSSPSKPTASSEPRLLPSKLPSVYILSPHPFPEVDDFVATSSSHYHLSLSRYSSPMKEAFTQYLHEHKHVKAILVGTRRTDPHGADLTHFDMTDGGWPRFMRVHPVIDWHYREIWGFIRHLNIPYCPLYDQGYTSLGGTTDTHPNPVLVAEDGKEKKFRPAYELVEDVEERLGRDY